jgi:hypothetical protein
LRRGAGGEPFHRSSYAGEFLGSFFLFQAMIDDERAERQDRRDEGHD